MRAMTVVQNPRYASGGGSGGGGAVRQRSFTFPAATAVGGGD